MIIIIIYRADFLKCQFMVLHDAVLNNRYIRARAPARAVNYES